MKKFVIYVLSTASLLLSLTLFAQTQGTDVIRYGDVRHPVRDREGMVVSSNILASEVGARVLADGGNAVDAAVAVGFTLAVVRPRAGNIGGGGFMLVFSAEDGETSAIDYREAAPRRASRDMFLDEQGNVDVRRARFSHLSSGVPGTVAGLHLAHETFGSLPWQRLLAPAIVLASEGYRVSYDMSRALERARERLGRGSSTPRYFYKAGGESYQPGGHFVHADHARTLTQLA